MVGIIGSPKCQNYYIIMHKSKARGGDLGQERLGISDKHASVQIFRTLQNIGFQNRPNIGL